MHFASFHIHKVNIVKIFLDPYKVNDPNVATNNEAVTGSNHFKFLILLKGIYLNTSDIVK
jgi:hypothetical protein